ncbi:MAG: molybdenum cofactor synthesis domain-containing protein [Candidatus Nanopelagicales bacterium]
MTLALVITVSTRAASGVYEDRSGPVIVEGLRSMGLEVDGPDVLPDGPELLAALREATQRYALVVTTGGTGLTPTDRTPEATRAVVDLEIPGLAEAIRARGVAGGVPSAVLSRGIVGAAGRCLVVNLAGSTGAARDGLDVLTQVLPHALDQLAGGDHPRH